MYIRLRARVANSEFGRFSQVAILFPIDGQPWTNATLAAVRFRLAESLRETKVPYLGRVVPKAIDRTMTPYWFIPPAVLVDMRVLQELMSRTKKQRLGMVF
jgi:hypothetical protein